MLTHFRGLQAPRQAVAAPRRRAAVPTRPAGVVCSQQGAAQPRRQQRQGDDSLMLLALKTAMLATAANAAVACLPPAAAAAAWRPRRHVDNRLQQKYRSVESAAQVRAGSSRVVACIYHVGMGWVRSLQAACLPTTQAEPLPTSRRLHARRQPRRRR